MSLVNDYEIKISIIVPVYNVKDKIERCLNSLNNQTYKNIEVLMINDGSTDGSERVCERFAETDTRFILINKPNGGVSTARNMGIKQAVGKYVMFVDSDDYVEVTACENMLNAIESSDSDLVIASFYSVKNNQIKEHICRYRVCYGVDEIADDFEYIYRECFINSPWNKLYKRELIKDFFKEDMRYFEDYYFNLDYMENIRSFVMTDKPVYYYVEDTNNSLTKVFRKDIFNVFPMIYKRQIQFFHKYSITEFDNLLKESLIYGLFNSIQKLVYSTNSKKDKLNLINEWINNEVVVEIVDDSFVRYVRDNCKSQYKVGYRYIIEKRCKHLYLFFKIKKAVMFILKLMRIR